MSIPTAVSPSQLTPGLYLTVDLLAGASSPGGGVLNILLMGGKSSGGDLTADTEVRAGGGAETAATAFGAGTPAHLAAKLLYGQFPAAQVDFISPAIGAGVATLNVTATGSPSGNNAVLFDVMGREFEVSWLSGESADDLKAKVIDEINSRTGDLFVTAVDGGVGVVTINAKFAGNVGNDVKVQANLKNAQTGTEAIDTNTATALSGGTTDPDYTTALSNVTGKEYHLIVPCLSNTDAVNVATKSNLSRIIDHIESLNSGLDAKLQQVVVGYSGTSIPTAVAAALNANGGQNSEKGQLITCINGRGLPGELAGREAGGRVAAESLDPAANRIGELMNEYIGAKDKIADKPTLAESEQALGGGVSLISYQNNTDLEVLVRPVTTHSQDSAGGADRRLLDVQNVSATYVVARDLRGALPQEFQGAKITKDVVPGDDPPPAGVIEERDIKAFIITRLRSWQAQGVVTQQSIDDAVNDGTLVVQVNASDNTQVDIVVPFSIVPPLAKMGVVVQRVPN